ncbi:MAG: hypothetical protein H8K10_15635 [Nitrospira sp.]|nr:hypothetical protein [Nitrospira sp.]
MTKLERQLAETFRAARWFRAEGRPSCPCCYDGADLDDPQPLEGHPGLYWYHCRVCARTFSDLSDTPMRSGKRALLWWAHLLLGGDAQAVTHAKIGSATMRRHLSISPVAGRWAHALAQSGIEVQTLRAAIDRQQAATGTAPARQPRGKGAKR